MTHRIRHAGLHVRQDVIDGMLPARRDQFGVLPARRDQFGMLPARRDQFGVLPARRDQFGGRSAGVRPAVPPGRSRQHAVNL